tara:strand:+ start:87 stop:1196 length:1110 start_codon:yes stop_codon:yes gene_type:complete
MIETTEVEKNRRDAMLKRLEKIISLKEAQFSSKAREQSITEIAKELNLARGTVKRWIDLKNIPEQYLFDLMKMSEEEIDYSQFTAKQKDQFFTSDATAQYCYEVFLAKMKEIEQNIEGYTYIEPSAGDGAFLKVLPENKAIGVDIEPRHKDTIKSDYLDWYPEKGEYIVFGNPPFGLRGHLALKFINHSYKFADYVCFILPQLFESDGKGSPRKRIDNFNLIHSEKLVTSFHDPEKRDMKINVVFQIWSKHFENKEYSIKLYNDDICTVYSLSNGKLKSQQRNTKMIGNCDFYLPSTCFGEDKMTSYDKFKELPGEKGYGIVINKGGEELIMLAKSVSWNSVAFLSTNSALNLRTSSIKEKIIFLFDKT